MTERCKNEKRRIGGYVDRCRNATTKDGWCGVHHPEAVAKRKVANDDRRRSQYAYEAKQRADRIAADAVKAKDAAEAPALRARIAELEAEVERLKEAAQDAVHAALDNEWETDQ